MQWTALFLLGFCLQVSAGARSQTITFTGKNVPLETIFTSIRQQTGFNVFGNNKQLKLAKPVTIEAHNMPLLDFLKQVFKNQPLTFDLMESTINFRKKELPIPNKQSATLFIPPVTIHGKIVNEKGEPVVASIIVKGTNKGTSTDPKGDFSIVATEDNILIVSAVGFETKEVKVSGEPVFITLKIAEGKLDEVIIQAYGTTSRRLNTGNISKVSGEEIARQPVSNPLATLEGRVPGLVISQTSGLPGGAVKVELRGRTAIDRNITDDQPLFIIDGVPFGPNNSWISTQGSALGQPGNDYVMSLRGGISPFNNLNPQDIESIEVLKDADATAIYGSRGANGVILITTKKGNPGKTKVDFNALTGISELARPVKMMNTQQYLNMRRAAFANDGTALTNANAFDLLVWDTTRNTDFANMLAGNAAHMYNAQLSLSGGKDQTTFLVSGNYRKETTILPGDFGDQQAGMHFHIGHGSANRKLNMAFSGSFNLGKNNLLSMDPMSSLADLPFHKKVYNEDGSLAWNEGGYRTSNGFANLEQKYAYKSNSVQANLQVNYAILPNLLVRANMGYNQNQVDENSQLPGVSQNPIDGIFRQTKTNTNRFNSWIIEPQLEYNQLFLNGKLTGLVGASWQSTGNEGTGIIAEGFSSDDLMGSINTAVDYKATNWNSDYRYQAVFARINYNYTDKYLLNLSARRDGSSRFGKGKQFANFGAVGAAWIFSNENWLKNKIGFLSFGKIRGSYGVTGNDKIANYQYLDSWTATPSTYYDQGGLYPSKLYNPDYRWEKTTKLEGALDAGFFKDRLLISAVYYSNRSSNQLVNYNLPTTAGFGSVIANLPAVVGNSGWEFNVSGSIIDRKDFNWTSTLNVTLPASKLISFPNLDKSSYASSYVEGQPLNLIRGYSYLGIDPQTGVYTFLDLDKNNVFNNKDYVMLGHTDPTAYGGWQNEFRYKNLQLDIFFAFRKQTGRSYLAGITRIAGNRGYNLPAAMTDFWTKPGDQATLQKLSAGYGINYDVLTALNRFGNSDGILTDASFIRLKNVALSYTLTDQLLKKSVFRQVRVYLQAQNLLTITGYEIGDPETQKINQTPPLRVFAAGLQITL